MTVNGLKGITVIGTSVVNDTYTVSLGSYVVESKISAQTGATCYLFGLDANPTALGFTTGALIRSDKIYTIHGPAGFKIAGLGTLNFSIMRIVTQLTPAPPAADQDYLLTENADFIMTENGDYITTG